MGQKAFLSKFVGTRGHNGKRILSTVVFEVNFF